MKPSVKERIGMPLNSVPTKKKIVVVRKKVPQNAANATPNVTKSVSRNVFLYIDYFNKQDCFKYLSPF